MPCRVATTRAGFAWVEMGADCNSQLFASPGHRTYRLLQNQVPFVVTFCCHLPGPKRLKFVLQSSANLRYRALSISPECRSRAFEPLASKGESNTCSQLVAKRRTSPLREFVMWCGT